MFTPLVCKARACGICVALFAGALPASAQVAEPAAAASAAAATQSPAMNIQQVIEHVARIGYRDIKEIERKGDKIYEVKARDAKGLWVELLVDARSGEILKSKLDR